MTYSTEPDPRQWEKYDFDFNKLRAYDPKKDSDKIQRFPLYMYVGEAALKSILSTGKIKFSRPLRTNDFMEGITQNEKNQNNIKQFGYICLTKKGNSEDMWGYYADRGRGACLAFNFEVFKIDDDTYEILKSGLFSPMERKFIRKVKYTDEPTRKNPLEILCHKHKTWEHEGEYRILRHLHGIHVSNIEYASNESCLVEYYDSDIMENLEMIILGAGSKYECVEVDSMLRKLLEKDRYKDTVQWLAWDWGLNYPSIFQAKAKKINTNFPSVEMGHETKRISVTEYMDFSIYKDFEILTIEFPCHNSSIHKISDFTEFFSNIGRDFQPFDERSTYVWASFKRRDGIRMLLVPIKRSTSSINQDTKVDFLLLREAYGEHNGNNFLQNWLWIYDVNDNFLNELTETFKKELRKKFSNLSLTGERLIQELFPEEKAEVNSSFDVSQRTTTYDVSLNNNPPSSSEIGSEGQQKQTESGASEN